MVNHKVQTTTFAASRCTHYNYVSTADTSDMRHTCSTCGAVRDVRIVNNKVHCGTWSEEGAHPTLAVFAIAQSCRTGQRISLEQWSESDRDHLMRVSERMHVTDGDLVLFVHKAWQVGLIVSASDTLSATESGSA